MSESGACDGQRGIAMHTSRTGVRSVPTSAAMRDELFEAVDAIRNAPNGSAEMPIKPGMGQFRRVLCQYVPSLTGRVVAGERSSGEAAALELFLEELRTVGDDAGIDPSLAVVHGTAGILGMDESNCGHPLRRQRPSETRKGPPEKIDMRVTKDRMREDVIKVTPAFVDLESVDTMEVRPLERDLVTADLLLDALFNQPMVRFHAVIIPAGEIRYEQPTGAQGPTTEIEQLMVLTQSQSAQQPELHGADQIVAIFGADIGAMRHRCRS
jgi:hypothetical protein